MTRHRKLVRFVPRKGAIEEVRRLNSMQKEWHYLWDEFAKVPNLSNRVALYKIPNDRTKEEGSDG